MGYGCLSTKLTITAELMWIRHPGFYSLRIWQLSLAEGSPMRSCLTDYVLPNNYNSICFSLVWAGSEIYFSPAYRLGSVYTCKYSTDKRLPLCFQNVKKKKGKVSLFIVALFDNKNNKCLCILCKDPSHISIWKMSEVCSLHFTSPSVFQGQFSPCLNARIFDCLWERYCHNLWTVQSCALLSFIFPKWAKHCPVFVTIL